ncbi:HNH endonuclease signature motif containing protein [Marinobacter salarius]|uniref:HNH endonuclease signature motif containing protein n=1 Tax=Marinobacter salarius TaxID=1420917 RepID=UPI003BAD1ABC
MVTWTAQKDDWLRSLYPDTPNRTIAKMLCCSYLAVKNRATTLGLKKDPGYMASKPGCFRPGQTSWNKGLSYQPGGRIAENQFKPGHKPQTWVPVGTEAVDKDGYLKLKVSDDRTVPSRYNWKFVHVMKWEEYHGQPVPPKHVVRLKDGNKRNFERENLVLVSMAENAILNKFFAMKNPPEGGFDVLLNLARIKLATTKRKREMA